MARHWFPAQFLVTAGPGNVLRASAGRVRFFDAPEGGNEVTDLLWGEQPASVIPTSADGFMPRFQGPDSVTRLYADAGVGRRVELVAEGLPGKDGKDGIDGLPGVNAVPADEAVGTYLETEESESRAGARAAVAADVATPGNPIHDALTGAIEAVGDLRYETRREGASLEALPLSNIWIAHHGGGAVPTATMPSAALSTLAVNASRGAMMTDLDVQLTSDGVLVNYHDPTTGEYCEYDVTVTQTPYSQLPLIDMRRRLGAGWAPERIPTVEEIFATLGGSTCFTAEMKTNGSATLPHFASLVRRYQLQESVVVNFSVASLGFAPQVIGEGLRFHVTGCTTVQHVEDAIAAGAHIVGVKWDASTAVIEAALEVVAARGGAGRVIAEGGEGVFGLWRRSQITEMDSRIHGYWNDAPGYLDAPALPTATDLSSAIQARRALAGTIARTPANLADPLEWLDRSKGMLVQDGATLTHAALRPLATEAVPASGRIDFSVMWEALPTIMTQYTGLRVMCPVDVPGTNPSSDPAHGGYRVFLRANGDPAIQSVQSNIPVSIGAGTGPDAVAGVPIPCRFEWTPTQVRLTRTDTNDGTGWINNTDWRGGFLHTVTTCATGKSRIAACSTLESD